MNMWLISTGFVILLCSITEGSKIIMLAAFGSRSHLNVFLPLLNELSSRGHDMTILTPMKLPNIPSAVKAVVVESNDASFAKYRTNVFNDTLKYSMMSNLNKIREMSEDSVRNLLEHPFIKEALKNGQTYDLAIVNVYMNDAAFVVAPLIAKNTIALSPATVASVAALAPPMSLATTPISLFAFGQSMTFFQRVQNVASAVIFPLVFRYATVSAAEGLVQAYLPNAPSVTESQEKVSLLFKNAEPVLTSTKNQVPTAIDVGAMHCRSAKSIPKEFEDFISDKDFIVFSLGSIAPSNMMPQKVREAFISAFARLKMKVIWKFEEPIQNIPPNVLVSPWIPQQDLLGHPRIRLFISHGGALSLHEAIYHGVPIIGIPLFADQPGNIHRIVELGAGERLDIDKINEDEILNLISEILNDKSYLENMKRYSSILHDQMEPPVKRAAYWVEYVIRHNGAGELLMQSGHLNVIQYFSLDIIGTIVAASIITTVITSIILKKLVTNILGKRS